MIPKRFERLTHALEGRCSIQLSYGTILICGCKGSAFYENSKAFRNFFIHIFLYHYKSAIYKSTSIGADDKVLAKKKYAISIIFFANSIYLTYLCTT